MGRIGFIHSEFHAGGAEAVFCNIVDEVQEEHQIHVFTLKKPSIENLNAQFNTAISSDEIGWTTHPRLLQAFDAANGVANAATGNLFGTQISLKAALHYRLIKSKLHDFDLVVTTKCELPVPSPAIQYIHQPMFNRHSSQGHFSATGFGRYYQQLITFVGGVEPEKVTNTHLITNSSWTANEIEKCYGLSPDVIHPPVNIEEFDRKCDWGDREDGFVIIGRISLDKHVIRAIDVIDRVREQSFETHLHLIGPLGGHTSAFKEEFLERVEASPYLHWEGLVPRSELVELVQTHKWGFHAKPFEHFGIAVAELVAGGAVPFVPDSGGQTEIVGNDERLLYGDVDEAVTRICGVLRGDVDTASIKSNIPDPIRYSTQRFQEEISRSIENKLPNTC